MYVLSEADFMINGYYKFKLFGQDIYITTTHISLLIISIVAFQITRCTVLMYEISIVINKNNISLVNLRILPKKAI